MNSKAVEMCFVLALVPSLALCAETKNGLSASATVPATPFNSNTTESAGTANASAAQPAKTLPRGSSRKGTIKFHDGKGSSVEELEKLEVKTPEPDTHKVWKDLRENQKED